MSPKFELFNKWELLSASQALTLYILLWLRTGTSHAMFPCGNIALLFTLGVRPENTCLLGSLDLYISRFSLLQYLTNDEIAEGFQPPQTPTFASVPRQPGLAASGRLAKLDISRVMPSYGECLFYPHSHHINGAWIYMR
jgi:hypothetical protein